MSDLYNDINMSDVLFEAIKISRGDYDFKNDKNKLSTTSLLNPPKYILLHARHRGEYKTPVSRCVRAFIGSCTHAGVERVELPGLISEKRLEVELDGFTISGKFDILMLTDDYGLEDIKVSTFFSIMYSPNGKKEWEQQMNIYAYLIWKCMNIRVKSLKINLIFYDWNPNIQRYFPKAPTAPEMTVELRLWSDLEVEKYLKERVAVYKEMQKLSDDDIPPCSKEDRWHQPKKYLVYKVGNKKPTKTFYNYGQCKGLLGQMTAKGVKYRVEVQDAKDNRCLQYCPANKFCNYYNETYNKNNTKDILEDTDNNSK